MMCPEGGALREQERRKPMKIVMLEAASLGDDLDFGGFAKYGELVIYGKTTRGRMPGADPGRGCDPGQQTDAGRGNSGGRRRN